MTLAQLKRDANSGLYTAEMVYRYGKEIPERLKGIRKITRANSVGIFLEKDGRESELRIGRAINIDYDGEHLTYYGIHKRPMTQEEENTLKDICQKSDNYWVCKKMADKTGYGYLFASADNATKWRSGGYIYDKNTRGEKEIEYIIRRIK